MEKITGGQNNWIKVRSLEFWPLIHGLLLSKSCLIDNHVYDNGRGSLGKNNNKLEEPEAKSNQKVGTNNLIHMMGYHFWP